MFTRPMKEFYRYSLVDSRGRSLDLDAYGLRAYQSWYQEDNYGVIYPSSLVSPPNRPANIGRVIEYVRRRGLRDHANFPLLLRCEVIGSRDKQTVGVLKVQEWTITDQEGSPGRE
jgi:hypothetical protein